MRLDEEHVLVRDTVRRFTEAEVIPFAERMDREERLVEGIWEKMAGLGILGPTIPEEYGGGGSDALSQVLICEELGRGDAGLGISYAAHANLCAHNLFTHGTEEQRRTYVPDLCAARRIGALALTEPGAGSDATGIRTRAVREGGYYRLNGSKMFITNAPIADVMLVYAKTASDRGAHGISAFIVETKLQGLRIARELHKMGNRSSPTAEVVFEDVMIPAENLLGAENGGVEVMMSGLDIERVVVAGISLGVAEAAFEAALRYSRDRRQFGKPICEMQLIQAKLADMYTAIETARAFLYDVAARTTREKRLRKESAAAILYTAEMATRVCLEAVQVHGGYGYMLEYPVNRYLRDAKLNEIGAGTSEIRRLLIAREILREG